MAATHLLLLSASLAAYLGASQSCNFTFPSDGLYWDLSALGAVMPWNVTVPASGTYRFAVCKDIPASPCPNGDSNSFQATSDAKQCIMSYGSAANTQARLLPSNGISVTYTDPATQCYAASGKPSYTTFSIFCDPQAGDKDVVVAPPTPDCGLQITIRTRTCPTTTTAGDARSGRPVRGLGVGWIVLIFLVIGVTFYVVAGCAYNRFKRGARGIEAMPHIAFWRGFYTRVTCRRFAGPAYRLPVDEGGGDYLTAEDPSPSFSFMAK